MSQSVIFCFGALISAIIVPIGNMFSAIRNSADLGCALRRARKARALRLEDVALTAGVGIRFVSELERGKATARMAETLRVAEALGVNLGVEDPLEQPDT